jgi:hypothetical protein
MIADLLIFKAGSWEGLNQLKQTPDSYQLLLVFGDRELISLPDIVPQLSEVFPEAKIIAASTAGEIYQNEANQNSIVCIAIKFQNTRFEIAEDNIRNYDNSYELGKQMAQKLNQKDLRYVMIISDGSIVNGDELIEGINEVLDAAVEVTGAMAGDGARFERTVTGVDGNLSCGNVILLGLYGNHIQVSSGVKGGWSLFGPERTITKSSENELFEIDQESALTLYKRYLGNFAKELPASALFFPIAILKDGTEEFTVRTILNVNEEKGSMTFAGNVPQGSRIRLMRTNTDQVINMASTAAFDAVRKNGNQNTLALIFNCIGRRLVLDSRANEEIQSITQNFTQATTVAGLYSYGEFSKRITLSNNCELHNQTVVVTVFDEY